MSDDLVARLDTEAAFMLDRPLVTRGQRIVVQGVMNQAADRIERQDARLAAIDALAINLIIHKDTNADEAAIGRELWRIIHDGSAP